MRISYVTSILGTTILLKLQTIKTPKTPTMGIASRIPGTVDFVTFLDYDLIKDEVLDPELRDLQQLFEVGDFHVFASNEFGRHVIGIDRLSLKENLELVEASSCDYHFKKGIWLNEYRTWILRIIGKGNRPKPKYLRTIESPHNGKNMQSLAHGLFLQEYYGAKVRLTNPDNNTVLGLQAYHTSSHVDVKDLKKLQEAFSGGEKQ